MSNLVIPAPKQITIPIHSSDQEFPVRRVYCIGAAGSPTPRRERSRWGRRAGNDCRSTEGCSA